MEQDHPLPEATTNTATTNTAMDDDTWDTQFLEAISAAMDAMEEEEENMWNAPLPSLEALEAAMEELPRCAYTKEKKTRYSIF